MIVVELEKTEDKQAEADYRQELAKIHQEALIRFDEIQSAVRDERLQCLQDRRFYSIAGAMWEDLQKQFENNPQFEINKIHLSIIAIFSEYRANRITVNFQPKDGGDDQLSDTVQALYRADEKDGGGQAATDNAFEEGVGGGMAAWRLRACYEDEEDIENEHQRIRFEPIFDADSLVFFDLGARRQDKADAKYCFVLTPLTIGAYKAKYDDDPSSWSKDIQQTQFDWFTPQVVYVAEYYKIEHEPQKIQVWENLDGEKEFHSQDEFEEDENLEMRLAALGGQKLHDRIIKKQRVHKYELSGARVEEDCGYIAGKYIPIIPYYAKRWVIDNVERCMGHVRLAKDAQRLKNMQVSKLGEISARSDMEKPILLPEQIAGHENMWADDNIKKWPYLLLNPIYDAEGNLSVSGPLAYTKSPTIPQSLAALLQLTDADIKELLGNNEKAEELQPNLSGRAVELIQNKLDMRTFLYISNLAVSKRWEAQVWLSMARELYAEKGRKMKGVNAQGKAFPIKLLETVENEQTKNVETINDLKKAKFDVDTEIGPTSSSKRAATVRNLMGMASITEDQQTKQVLGALAMLNMEGEGLTDVRDFFRKKLVQMGVIKPTPKELEQMIAEQQNAPPDPNAEYLKSAAEAEQARAAKARADTVLTVAKAEKTKIDAQKTEAETAQTRADTVKTVTQIDKMEQEQAMEVIDKFTGQ